MVGSQFLSHKLIWAVVDTQTPMLNAATKLIPPEALGPIHALHPFKGLGEPDDIARAALFLASEDASWITGQCLAVDGGFTTR